MCTILFVLKLVAVLGWLVPEEAGAVFRRILFQTKVQWVFEPRTVIRGAAAISQLLMQWDVLPASSYGDLGG